MKYICNTCGYIYDEEEFNIDMNVMNDKWDDLPCNWVCPMCFVEKNEFSLLIEE